MELEPNSPVSKQLSHGKHHSKVNTTERSQIKSRSMINQLYHKFMTINSQIVIEHDLSAFNMAEFDKDNLKTMNDQQMKLKKLQNKAQLQRAIMELEHRRKKSPKHQQKHLLNNQEDEYMHTYKKFINNPSRKLFEAKSDTDSEDQGKKKTEEPVLLSGVNHFNELRRHPRFLQYTMDKIKQKETEELEEKKQKIEDVETMRNQIKTMSLQNKALLSARAKLQNTDPNPESIADNIFRKIYTKRNKELSMEQAKTEHRIAKIIDKQDSILDQINQRSLSKENYKKLKVRLGLIVAELYHDDKKHQTKSILPKIKNNSSKMAATIE